MQGELRRKCVLSKLLNLKEKNKGVRVNIVKSLCLSKEGLLTYENTCQPSEVFLSSDRSSIDVIMRHS